ncbi:MAG: hypothetical protein KGZ85_11125 [Ignavibacterium sp.]|nr:hypothetical protein [Ignavibacterium sp.]
MGHNRDASGGRINEKDIIDNNPEVLQHLIQQLDSLRAFRRLDISKLETYFRRAGLNDKWKMIKPDLESIIYLPNNLPQVSSLIKIAVLFRQLFPACFFAVILVFLVNIGLVANIPNIFYRLALVMPFVIIGGFIVTDMLVRKRIASYENNNPQLHSKEKERIRKVIEDIVYKLALNIKELKLDPSDYKMRLYYDDYREVKIEKAVVEKMLGLFKRNYRIYIGIPFSDSKH